MGTAKLVNPIYCVQQKNTYTGEDKPPARNGVMVEWSWRILIRQQSDWLSKFIIVWVTASFATET